MPPAFVPDIASLRASVEHDGVPPAGLPPALRALWLAAKAGWRPTEEAHAALNGGRNDRDSTWVRAYLCRAAGDIAKSEGLYAAAARPVPAASLQLRDEWARIASTLLGDMLQRGLADTKAEAEAAAAAAANITDPVTYLEALGMRSIPHGSRQANLQNGTFMDHLCGVEQAMRSWGLPDALCLAGLFHSVYGTQGFGYYTLPLAHRDKVQQLIGKRGEAAVYYNCVMDRGSFDDLVLATVAAMDDTDVLPKVVPGVLRARPNPKTGFSGQETFKLTPAEFSDLVTLYNADNFDNVDETMKTAGQVPYNKGGRAGRWVWEAGALPTVRREAREAAARLCGGAVADAIGQLLAMADASGAPPAVWLPDDDDDDIDDDHGANAEISPANVAAIDGRAGHSAPATAKL